MATTVTVPLTELLQPNTATPNAGVTPSSYAATDTVLIPMTDKGVIVAITGATGAGTLTVAKGTGIGASNDLAISTVKDKTVFVQLDSSSYEDIEAKQADGTTNPNYGYAVATATGNGGSIVAVSAL